MFFGFPAKKRHTARRAVVAAVAAVAALTTVLAPSPANAAPAAVSAPVTASAAAAWPYTCAPTLKAIVTVLPPSVVISGTGFVPGDTVFIYIQKGPVKILLVKVVANAFGAILTGNLIAAILAVALKGEVNILGIDVTAGICLNVQVAVQLTITGLGTVLLAKQQSIDGLPAASALQNVAGGVVSTGSAPTRSSGIATSGAGFFSIAGAALALLLAGAYLLGRRHRTRSQS